MIEASLVGNPNTGKTTLFNTLSSSNEHVGNWHGVTVEQKGKIYSFEGQQIKLVDLPGLYSLTALSYEEEVASDFILENKDKIVVNICDASNLERNLYLTLGLMELGCPVVLAVNQIDKRPIVKTNYSLLAKRLGVRVVPINASRKESAKRLNEEIIALQKEIDKDKKIEYNLPYIKKIDFSFVKSFLPQNCDNRLFLGIKLLENDEKIKKNLKIEQNFDGLEEMAYLRYEYIEKVLSECCSEKVKTYGKSKLDKIFLNKFLALPIFIVFLALTFYLTFFSVGAWLSSLLRLCLDKIVGAPLVSFVSQAFGETSWVKGLVETAIVGGFGSILSFLPQVALLFFFLSILEDSGYLSRVAFVFDDILSKVGLSGKSVYTLLMGFGCSTTAILTARNMEDKNSKIKTSLLAPYMSCSAKFPIYTVLGGAFFGAKNIFVILGLYLLGVLVALLISLIFEKTALKSKAQSFILEFPPYRMMSAKRVTKVLWQNVKLFVTRVGTTILAMNIIVWILANFSFEFKYTQGGSMLESLGKLFAPIFAPIGFNNWGLASCLIAGLIAKEVIVSSIAMFNSNFSNIDIQKSLLLPSSVIFFASKSACLSFLVFCLLYSPCLASISVLKKEIGLKWTLMGVALQFAIAYLVSFMIYTSSLLVEAFGLSKSILFLLVVLAVIFALVYVSKLVRHKKCPYCSNCQKSCKKK